jgi:type IX secretion system PorP/SprF family membrane protein
MINKNKMNFKLTLSLIAILFSTVMSAQQLPLFNSKIMNEYLTNPAAAGEKDRARATGVFRTMYDNMPNSPICIAVMADGRLKNQVSGVGFQIVGQRNNVNAFYNGMFTYSHKIKFDKAAKNQLTFGISAGAFLQQTDFTQIKVNNQNDVRLPEGMSNNLAFNANFGLLYKNKNLRLSGALNNIISNTATLSSQYIDTFSLYHSKLHYFASVTYPIDISGEKGSKVFILEPYLALNGVSGISLKTDLMVTVRYQEKYNFGIGYRMNGFKDKFATGSIVTFVTVKMADRIDIGYFFEKITNRENNISLGNSHEVQLTYNFPIKK